MPALQVALECTAVVFGPAYHINNFKRTVERWIAKSYGSPEVRARFAHHAAFICENGLGLDDACEILRLDCQCERPFERIRLPGMVRKELFLILRWLRAQGMHQEFAETVAAERAALLRRQAGAIHQRELVEA